MQRRKIEINTLSYPGPDTKFVGSDAKFGATTGGLMPCAGIGRSVFSSYHMVKMYYHMANTYYKFVNKCYAGVLDNRGDEHR